MSAPSPAVLDLMDRLVSFDTVSARSNLALIRFVSDLLGSYGIGVRLTHGDNAEKANLYATIGPDRPGGIVLSGHTDVVPVEGQPWTSDPFRLTRRGTRIYGRGTTDMKGFIATVLALLPEMTAEPLATPIHFAFSFDEEVGCAGVPHLLAELGDALPLPSIALIGEPTEMRPVAAHKGIHGFLTRFRGRDGHSSAPHRGSGAIFPAAEAITYLARIAEELKSAAPPDSPFDPPYTTLNIGTVAGGTAINILPRECRFVWEFRPIPETDADWLVRGFETYLQGELLTRMRETATESEISNERLCAAPPLRPEPDSPAERLARLLTGANASGAVSFATEAGLFQAKQISAIVCGPGSIAQAHQPDEFIEEDQLAECEAMLRRLIEMARRGVSI
ncbi:MAG TPA: acetylornithine deacetylase [Alphaproteobacteria bacterium]|nr:acetylornithine deacetylase [Alphaproteobacteria bacterium]